MIIACRIKGLHDRIKIRKKLEKTGGEVGMSQKQRKINQALGHKALNIYQIESRHLRQSSELITFQPPEQAAYGHKPAKIYVEEENLLARIWKIDFERKVGCMNFASPMEPGGGFLMGYDGQEETICRNSFLYPELKKFNQSFYELNRKVPNQGYFSPNVIYSNQVKVLRDQSEGKILPYRRFIDFASVSAPNITYMKLRQHPLDFRRIQADLHEKILRTIRMFKNNEVEILILGAFGCGVSQNDPYLVAQTFKQVLDRPEFLGVFKEVYFPILNNKSALNIFNRVLVTPMTKQEAQ